MSTIFVIGMNLVVLLVLGAAGYAFNWSGPGFALGFTAGFTFFFVYFRLKHGYWP